MRDSVSLVLFAAAGAALIWFGGTSAGPYWQIVALNLAMWIALTQSWSLFSGLTGYISLGHAVAYGLGAYTMVLLFREWPIWFIVPLGGVVAGLFALIVAIPVLRVRGPYFVIPLDGQRRGSRGLIDTRLATFPGDICTMPTHGSAPGFAWSGGLPARV